MRFKGDFLNLGINISLNNDNHVEVVYLLSKLKSKHHINVELKMDEFNWRRQESKATYEEIKDYVLQHTGFKALSLYIAQVKEKCGTIERKNYNKPKFDMPDRERKSDKRCFGLF